MKIKEPTTPKPTFKRDRTMSSWYLSNYSALNSECDQKNLSIQLKETTSMHFRWSILNQREVQFPLPFLLKLHHGSANCKLHHVCVHVNLIGRSWRTWNLKHALKIASYTHSHTQRPYVSNSCCQQCILIVIIEPCTYTDDLIVSRGTSKEKDTASVRLLGAPRIPHNQPHNILLKKYTPQRTYLMHHLMPSLPTAVTSS